MFDAHCHLDFSHFDSDREYVIGRAINEAIGIITCAVDGEGVNKTLKFYDKFYESKRFFMCFGISPTNLNENEIKNFVSIAEKHNDKTVGLGEIGLDYYWVKDEKEREKQRINFKNFIKLSNKLNKKMIIHSRNAERDVIEILKESDVNAMMHCFSGSIEQALEAIDLGCIISITTLTCLSKEGQKMIDKIPIEHIVTETDAPFLSPFQKVRNEPFNIKYLIQKIAEIKNLSCEKVSSTTEENLRNFFKF